MIKIIPLSAFNDNYIWSIHNTAQSSCVIVDPGDAAPVLAYLASNNLNLVAILLTHHHADHCGGVAALLANFPVPVYGPAHDNIPLITHPLTANMQVELLELELQFSVLDIPGHTAGHIAYHGSGMLFCGDTLFLGGCGRIFEGTPAQLYNSLTQLAALPETTLIYCAHEYTVNNLKFAQVVEPNNTAIQLRLQFVQEQRAANLPSIPAPLQIEKKTNPFLRCHLPELKQRAEAVAGQSLASPLEVFTVIRNWKNNFIA